MSAIRIVPIPRKLGEEKQIEACAQVPSETNPLMVYSVLKYHGGRVTCNCGDFLFRKPKLGCKHIKKVMSEHKGFGKK